jgi:hypothetical protein
MQVDNVGKKSTLGAAGGFAKEVRERLKQQPAEPAQQP